MLDEGLFVYQFAPPDGEIEGLNFMAIVEDATAACDPPFIGREWHEHNYR